MHCKYCFPFPHLLKDLTDCVHMHFLNTLVPAWRQCTGPHKWCLPLFCGCEIVKQRFSKGIALKLISLVYTECAEKLLLGNLCYLNHQHSGAKTPPPQKLVLNILTLVQHSLAAKHWTTEANSKAAASIRCNRNLKKWWWGRNRKRVLK